jgi:hypothetical protein
LLNSTYSAGFHLEEILPYAIHTNVPNYLSIIFSRKKELSEMNASLFLKLQKKSLTLSVVT